MKKTSKKHVKRNTRSKKKKRVVRKKVKTKLVGRGRERKFLSSVKKKKGIRKSTVSAAKRRTRKQYSQQTFKKAVFNEMDTSSIKMNQYSSYEYLYFRNCELRQLDIRVNFPNLRVLDVSCNKISDLHFLQYLPNIRHVFASCNNVGSFHNVTFVKTIETLGLSGNGIRDFDGFEPLPNLKVLNLMFNDINDLSNFPALPSLERVNMIHNPVCDNDGFKNMILALTSDSSPKLSHINEGRVTASEKKICTSYTGRISLCARDGFLPDESEEAPPVEDQVTEFLLGTSINETRGNILSLVYQEIEGVQAEGRELSFKTYFVVEHPRAAIKEIPGLKRHNFMVTSGCRQVTLCLNDKIKVVMKKNPKAPKHLIIMLLPPGEYMYQYLYDGRTMSEPSPTTVPPPDLSSNERGFDYILRMRWMRYDKKTGFTEIDGQTDFSYTPRNEDLGRVIKASLDLFHTRNVDALFEIRDMTREIQGALPVAMNVKLVGNLLEGETLRPSYDYLGGEEGRSLVRIYCEGGSREEEMAYEELEGEKKEEEEEEEEGENGEMEGKEEEEEVGRRKKKVKIRDLKGSTKITKLQVVSEYRIRRRDVGKRIVCEVVPIRSDGTRGEVVRYFSDEVKAAQPKLENLRISGSFVQDSELTAEYDYSGGKEGVTEVTWYTYDLITRAYTNLIGKGKTVKLDEGCVGRGIRVTVLPVSKRGMKGDVCELLQDDVEVRALEPRIVELRIMSNNGNNEEGNLLTVHAEYYGGVEGESSVRWFRVKNPDELDGKTFIAKATGLQYRINMNDIGWYVGVEYVPVRQDGVQGKKVSQVLEKGGLVQPSVPTCEDLRIEGEEVSGSMLTCKAVYFGGKEGESEILWYRIGKEGKIENIGSSKYYMCCEEDVNHMIKVEFRPRRDDGVVSEETFSAVTKGFITE